MEIEIRNAVRAEGLADGRICSKCELWKEWSSFRAHKGGKNNKRSSCNECLETYRVAYAPGYYAKNGASLKAKQRARHATNPLRGMLNASRRRALKSSIEHAISMDDLERLFQDTNGVCPISKRPFVVSSGGRGFDSPSLDRIDNTKGYVLGNVWIISWRYNFVKSDSTVEELITLVEALKAHEKCRA